METDTTTKFKLINSKPDDLLKIIQTARDQLTKNN
jgi:hypothetical protein